MEASKEAPALKHAAHYVSPESTPHEPTSVDTDHASLGELGPDPTTETMDGQGIQSEGDHSQQVGEDPAAQGAQPEAQVTTSRVTLGRHVKHEIGARSAERRHQHIKTTRAAREKANFPKK